MRRALIVLVVVLATLAGAVGGLTAFRLDRQLDVGSVRLSVDPGHRGALDLYVPLVDWGVRFPVVRLPARINVDVRSVDRDAVVRLAEAGRLDIRLVREQATDALASYLRLAIVVATLAGLALGVLVALAVRGGPGPRLRWTLPVAVLTSLAAGGALAVLLPPRSNVGSPQYYANGPEVPAALRTLESLGASSKTLDEELDEQLVGIARLVTAPAGRPPIALAPRLTVASDLHNNVLALPALESASRGRPLLFTGDLTDRGSAVEQALVLRIVRAGKPFVFVSGNHDSDVLERKLARAGAIVLTRDGRLNGDGAASGPVVVRVGGLRVAGYDAPNKRLARERYRDRGGDVTGDDQHSFDGWLANLAGKVDIVMIHSPALAQRFVANARLDPPTGPPLLILQGHTHKAGLERIGSWTLLNPGSVGGGGTGNLADGGGDIGLARVIYLSRPSFAPQFADLIEIDPGNGEAQARRLDLGADE